MTSETVGRPGKDEFAPFYAGYMEHADVDDILTALEDQCSEVFELFASLPVAMGDHRYAPGKWTIKEVLGHVIDSERVFAYRALSFARGDRTPLPGFEQDDYVKAADFGRRPMENLLAEFEHVRLSNLALFRSFDADEWRAQGVANEVSFSVRALAHIIYGHAAHHLGVIHQRYLSDG